MFRNLLPRRRRQDNIEFSVSPLILEIIKDELTGTDSWRQSRWDDSPLFIPQHNYPDYLFLQEEWIRDEVLVSLRQKDKIIINGLFTKSINKEVDIETNEENLIALIEWIQDGGQFPLLKEEADNG